MQLTVFITTIWSEILPIFNTFKIKPNTNWKDVCKPFQKHFTPEVDTTYEICLITWFKKFKFLRIFD